ncbi:MAG: DNA primase [Anaerolineae bacterium]|nr:DNA primase [Anaerolineae bacterium]
MVDEIKQRLDIVELIGSYVPLQKAGRNYKAICPFHSEKTPSFVVFPDTQSWHCFGACSTGGDAFTFVMRQENLDFPEALRLLADKAGVQLTPLDEAEMERRDEVDRLRAIHTVAAQYYHRILLESEAGSVARDYLERRGVSRQTMASFQLGYALDDWHALEMHLQREHFSAQDMLAAGLLSESERGNVYDRFRGRVMFPIRDIQGHVIGFGGRVLDDSEPKYLNSPETPLFQKGSVLYGIDLARQSIRASETAIIVEGYLDVIIPYQSGIRNLVACMGTALSEAQIAILKRIAKTIILALDPDAAGLRAVERGIETMRQTLPHRVVPVLTASGLVRYEEQLDAEIRILRLPEGLDPDELVLADRARWDRLVQDALGVAEHFFRLVLEETDLSSGKGKREAAERLLPVIAAMDSPVERTHYLQRLATALHVDERDLLPEIDRLRGVEPRTNARPGARRAPSRVAPAKEAVARPTLSLEERTLALFLVSPSLLGEVVSVSNLAPDAFEDIRNRQVFERLRAYLIEHPGADVELFEGSLDSELGGHVESILQRLYAGPPLSADVVREDALKSAARLHKRYLARLMQEYRFMQQDAQMQGTQDEIKRFNQMIEQLLQDYLDVDRCFHALTLVGRKQAHRSSLSQDGR